MTSGANPASTCATPPRGTPVRELPRRAGPEPPRPGVGERADGSRSTRKVRQVRHQDYARASSLPRACSPEDRPRESRALPPAAGRNTRPRRPRTQRSPVPGRRRNRRRDVVQVRRIGEGDDAVRPIQIAAPDTLFQPRHPRLRDRPLGLVRSCDALDQERQRVLIPPRCRLEPVAPAHAGRSAAEPRPPHAARRLAATPTTSAVAPPRKRAQRSIRSTRLSK